MAEIIARFADGRLLVQEDRIAQSAHVSGTGTPIRIGLVKTVEKILALDSYLSGFSEAKVAAPIADAKASGDTILVRLRRADAFPSFTASGCGSGLVALENLSGITSGLNWGEELHENAMISGRLKIFANVIGY